MTHNSFELTAQQVLVALINAPASLVTATMQVLEPADFDDWIHRTIYVDGLTLCRLADHQEPGSVIVQINQNLLTAGHYRNTDNGLRQAVMDLAGMAGHPEQLPMLATALIEERYRREVGAFALAAAEHATNSPLADVDAALARITELRRLRSRITANAARLSTKAGAA